MKGVSIASRVQPARGCTQLPNHFAIGGWNCEREQMPHVSGARLLSCPAPNRPLRKIAMTISIRLFSDASRGSGTTISRSDMNSCLTATDKAQRSPRTCARTKIAARTFVNSATIEFKYLRQHRYCFIHRVNDGTGDALVDDFRGGAVPNARMGVPTPSPRSSLGRTALASRSETGARPPRPGIQVLLRSLISPMNSTPLPLMQRGDHFAKIAFVHLVDLGGDLQRNADRPRYLDGAIGSLF